MKQDIGSVVEPPPAGAEPTQGLSSVDPVLHDPRFAFISIRDALVGLSLIVVSLVAVVWWLFQPSQTGRGVTLFPALSIPVATSPAAATTVPFKAPGLPQRQENLSPPEAPVAEPTAAPTEAVTNTDQSSPVINSSETEKEEASTTNQTPSVPIKLRIRPISPAPEKPMGLPTATTPSTPANAPPSAGEKTAEPANENAPPTTPAGPVVEPLHKDATDSNAAPDSQPQP